MNKLLTISELSKKLSLIDPSSKKPLNYTLRYWEKEFNEIKPKKINNRRYYSQDQVEIIKMIKFLLINEGVSISGVKKILKSNVKKLDDYDKHGLKIKYYKNLLNTKTKKILKKISELKKYGKKISY